MLRPLTPADTAASLKLLRLRPLHNVFLEHVVRSGGLGVLPGFVGYSPGDSLEGILLIGPNGGTALATVGQDACAPLAEAAWRAPARPRHIVGPEDTTLPFWRVYSTFGARAIWERREPVYVATRETARGSRDLPRLVTAREEDTEAVVENSAQQYREDLQDDRFSAEPVAFRERHRGDIRNGRWWVLWENGRVIFQVHVGAENDHVVQLGGVFTVPDRRNQGVATRAVAAMTHQLLEHRAAVSLFCDEANVPARRTYERVGFQPRFYYRSWLLEGP